MSNWTHVAGIIRVNGVVNQDFDEVIGKECLWESPEKVWDDARENPDKYLPMGSEGSLHKTIWINPDGNCLPRYTISIFGDLRDHDSADEIIEWFKEKCKSLWVRNAVITVSNCYYGTKVWSYIEPKEGKWIKIEPYPLQMHEYKCSECGYETDDNTENYCSECGAKMEAQDEKL